MKFSVNKNLFGKDDILNTAYVFSENFFIDFKNKKEEFEVIMESKTDKKSKPDDLAAIEAEFKNELIYQSLRSKIMKKNHDLREYIVGKALIGADPEAAAEMSELINTGGVADNPLDVLRQ